MVSTASATALSASRTFTPQQWDKLTKGAWQLEEDLRFPLYRQWTKPTKKEPVAFQRDRLPLHEINWHNRETRRSKWFKQQGEKR
jgi:hypothetical protein